MIGQIDSNYVRMRPLKLWSRLISYGLFEGRPLTTRGRWINPVVFSFLSVAKNLPLSRKVKKPVFIIGTGRSGTTILGIVLSMHRDVGFLNEPKALWHSIYPGEDLIGSYTGGPARYRLDSRDVTDGIRRFARRLYGAYSSITCARRIVDKYPELIFRVPFVRAIFPDAKFLFLARNGWDTCHSIDSWSRRLSTSHDEEVHDWWGINNRKWNLLVSELVQDSEDLKAVADEVRALTAHTDMAAVEWILSMKEGLRLVQDLPESVYMVRYEDIASRTEETLSKVLAFCELPEDATFFRYAGRVLHLVPPKPPFRLHPAIEPAFRRTMNQMDYPAA